MVVGDREGSGHFFLNSSYSGVLVPGVAESIWLTMAATSPWFQSSPGKGLGEEMHSQYPQSPSQVASASPIDFLNPACAFVNRSFIKSSSESDLHVSCASYLNSE